MFTRVPRSGPDTGHVLVVPFSRFLPAHLFWDPMKPSCRKECAPVRRKSWRAGYPNLSRTLPAPRSPPNPPRRAPSSRLSSAWSSSVHYPSTAPRGRPFSTWQFLFQPEVGAVYCLASSPAGLGGIPFKTPQPPKQMVLLPTSVPSYPPSWSSFSVWKTTHFWLQGLRSPVFERRRLEGPGEDLVGVVFLSEEVNAGKYGVKS